MKRSNQAFTLVELIVVLGIMLLLVAFLFPVFTDRHNYWAAKRASCQSNLKQIALGLAQYTFDYDGRFPRVRGVNVITGAAPDTVAYGWADAVYPYIKSTKIMKCPRKGFQGSKPTDPTQKGYTDYWFNQRLSGADSDKMNVVALSITMGDGKDEQNSGDARYAIMGLPEDWRTREESPAQSHLGGANYAFADGHVKFYLPNRIQNNAPVSLGKPTFRTGG